MEREREEAEKRERTAQELADKERKKAEQERARAAAEAQKKRKEKEQAATAMEASRKQRQESTRRTQKKAESEQGTSTYDGFFQSQFTSDCGLQSLAVVGGQSITGFFIYTHVQ